MTGIRSGGASRNLKAGLLIITLCSLSHYASFSLAEPVKVKSVAVQSCGQTTPVASTGDAADDPAIWIHHGDPDASLILGTDKKRGLAAYALDGTLKQFLELGAVNNVDLRQALRFDQGLIDLAVLSHRHHRSVDLVKIETDGTLKFLGRFPTQLPDVYGICMTRTDTGGADVLVNSKTGLLHRYSLDIQRGLAKGKLEQAWIFNSQIEACVVDDEQSTVYVSEENRGIWSIDLRAPQARPQWVLGVGEHLRADVEGLALVNHPKHGRLLIASSQGDSHFVVLQSRSPYRVLGRFSVADNSIKGIDAVDETDGIEVFGGAIGSKFPGGLLVVQDGSPGGENRHQNFKLICWDQVLSALDLN